MTRIVACLFQVMLVALIYALVSGKEFSSYYIFYGSLFFGVLYVSCLRYGYEALTGALLRAAGYQRRAVLVEGLPIEILSPAGEELQFRMFPSR